MLRDTLNDVNSLPAGSTLSKDVLKGVSDVPMLESSFSSPIKHLSTASVSSSLLTLEINVLMLG